MYEYIRPRPTKPEPNHRVAELLFKPSSGPSIERTPMPCSFPQVGTGSPESWLGGQMVNYGEMKEYPIQTYFDK